MRDVDVTENVYRNSIPFYSGRIVKIFEVEDITIRGLARRVQKAVLDDGHGEIYLNLWDDHAGQLIEGDIVNLLNCWINEFHSSLELNIGRFGKIYIRKEAGGNFEGEVQDDRKVL